MCWWQRGDRYQHMISIFIIILQSVFNAWLIFPFFLLFSDLKTGRSCSPCKDHKSHLAETVNCGGEETEEYNQLLSVPSMMPIFSITSYGRRHVIETTPLNAGQKIYTITSVISSFIFLLSRDKYQSSRVWRTNSGLQLWMVLEAGGLLSERVHPGKWNADAQNNYKTGRLLISYMTIILRKRFPNLFLHCPTHLSGSPFTYVSIYPCYVMSANYHQLSIFVLIIMTISFK